MDVKDLLKRMGRRGQAKTAWNGLASLIEAHIEAREGLEGAQRRLRGRREGGKVVVREVEGSQIDKLKEVVWDAGELVVARIK